MAAARRHGSIGAASSGKDSVLTQSVVWGIDAFDQWGVELGKKLTAPLAPAVQDPAGAPVPAGVMKLLTMVQKWRQ
jgi:glucose-6-phosphate isomerase